MTMTMTTDTDALIANERKRVGALARHVRGLLQRIEDASEGVLYARERAELDAALADAREALTRADAVAA